MNGLQLDRSAFAPLAAALNFARLWRLGRLLGFDAFSFGQFGWGRRRFTFSHGPFSFATPLLHSIVDIRV
jgi:hypothetical protein